jgi:hypothetical protein
MLVARLQPVTDAAHGVDQFTIWRWVDFSAEIVDVYVHDVGHFVGGQIPDMLKDLRARDMPASVAHEIFKERKFLGRKCDFPPAARDRMIQATQLEIVHLQHSVGMVDAATNQRLDARRQLGKSEWFEDKIVRTQAEHLRVVFRARADSE